MEIQELNIISNELSKSHFLVIESIVNNMNNEEYDGIPIFKLDESELNFIKKYAITTIVNRELNKFSEKKPYYELYYVSPTLFKVRNENK